MAEPTVGDMMAAYAEDAVDHAKSACGVTLDYSPESIRSVETAPKNEALKLAAPSRRRLGVPSRLS